MGRKNILLVGLGYWPGVQGDKAFWVRLTPLLSPHIDRLIVASFVPQSAQFPPGQRSVVVNYLRTAKLCGPANNGLFRPGQLQVLVSTARAASAIRRMVNENRIDVVHFMDPGLAVLPWLRLAVSGTRLSTTVISIRPRALGYWRTLSLLLERSTQRIMATSNAVKRDLMAWGVAPDKVTIVRWGVQPAGTTANRSELKGRLGISEQAKLILWTGPLQQTRLDEFGPSIAAAKSLAAANTSLQFIFAIKPGYYAPNLVEQAADRVAVIRGKEMTELYGVTDLLLSPVCNPRIVLGPPLTWLEAMSHGVPVFTTPSRVVNEVIEDGHNGRIVELAALEAELSRTLSLLEYQDWRHGAVATIERSFNLHEAAESYIGLWEEI